MYLFKLSFNVSFYNFTQHCGFNGICCTLCGAYCLLYKNRNVTFTFLFIPLTGQYAFIVLMVLFKLLVPNSSPVYHVIGYFIPLWMYNMFSYVIFPKVEWIVDFEKKMNLDKRNTIRRFIMYVSVDSDENVVQNVKEINRKFNCICKKKSTRGSVNVDIKTNNNNNNSSGNSSSNNNEQEMQVITN